MKGFLFKSHRFCCENVETNSYWVSNCFWRLTSNRCLSKGSISGLWIRSVFIPAFSTSVATHNYEHRHARFRGGGTFIFLKGEKGCEVSCKEDARSYL